MRSFYVLAVDASRRDLQSLIDADLADFDITILSRGDRFDGLPSDMRLYVSNKKRTHLLGNAFSWMIMSEEALALAQSLVPECDIQVCDILLFDFKQHEPVGGYYLVNILLKLPALAFEPGSEMLYAHLVVIKDSCVPPDTHLFRLTEAPRYWIVTEQLWQKLSKLDGVGGVKVQTVP